jgi:ABC-type branched-subunit amino acid transport system ATPase component
MAALLELANVGPIRGLRALTGVSLEARRGEVKAIIGPNGAGKTTLFNVISGYVTATTGAIRFQGQDIHDLTPHEIAAKGVRRTFQMVGPVRRNDGARERSPGPISEIIAFRRPPALAQAARVR